jgi:hypothetical protein
MKKRLCKIGLTVVVGFGVCWGGSALASNVHSTALQDELDIRTEGGTFQYDVETGMVADQYDSAWYMLSQNYSSSMILFEIAGYAGTNSFGIYDLSDTSNRLTIFNGAASAENTANIFLTLNDQTNEFSANGVTKTFSSSNFGFYLESPQTVTPTGTGVVWYSDTANNADNEDHMFAYEGTGESNFDFDRSIAQTESQWTYTIWNSDTWILAWEDLYGPHKSEITDPDDPYGDRDFTDFVVSVTNVSNVPEPTTMLLFGAGLAGLAGARRRKKN